jgi:hypothetical protein
VFPFWKRLGMASSPGRCADNRDVDIDFRLVSRHASSAARLLRSQSLKNGLL